MQLPTLLSLADKAIASMKKWEEESTGYSYIEELMKCIRDGTQKETIEKTRLVLHALKKLPLKEHKMAILRFFLNWPTKKAAKALAKKPDAFEKEYEAMLHQLVGSLGDEEIFNDILSNKLQKPLSLVLKKTYPLSLCEIRILEIKRPLEKDEIPKISKKR